jgi:DMSO/TMAO reductase YedYZ molybdopterin-dependent catalytic subunit
MKRIKLIFIAPLFLITCYVSHAQIKTDSNFVIGSVSVSGKIKHPMVLTVESLKNMKVFNGNGAKIMCNSGEHKKTMKTFKAVLLRDVLDSASIIMDRKKDRGKFIIVVTASDQYTVVFSYNELYYGKAGNNIYVVFEENGKPLTQEGEIIVFCSSDIVSGPRHVKWVKSIEVKEIECKVGN